MLGEDGIDDLAQVVERGFLEPLVFQSVSNVARTPVDSRSTSSAWRGSGRFRRLLTRSYPRFEPAGVEPLPMRPLTTSVERVGGRALSIRSRSSAYSSFTVSTKSRAPSLNSSSLTSSSTSPLLRSVLPRAQPCGHRRSTIGGGRLDRHATSPGPVALRRLDRSRRRNEQRFLGGDSSVSAVAPVVGSSAVAGHVARRRRGGTALSVLTTCFSLTRPGRRRVQA